jgi:hypothetical protein
VEALRSPSIYYSCDAIGHTEVHSYQNSEVQESKGSGTQNPPGTLVLDCDSAMPKQVVRKSGEPGISGCGFLVVMTDALAQHQGVTR